LSDKVPPSDDKVIETLHKFATNKVSGYERESAAMAFQSFAAVLGPPAAPVLLPSLPTLFDLYMDKGEVVRQAAAAATKAILKLFPPESTRLVFKTLEGVIENGKWRTKVGALDAMRTFVIGAEGAVATELATALPAVTAAMHDTKNEVCSTSIIQSNVR
jgi:elongation factor 3